MCQLAPEAGHPPYIAAKLKKIVYGVKDAPQREWNILDKALRINGIFSNELIDACYVLHSIESRERAREY